MRLLPLVVARGACMVMRAHAATDRAHDADAGVRHVREHHTRIGDAELYLR
jgi:hypothetical protein